MTQSIFDSQRFLQSLANDRELGEELLAAFLEDSPHRQASLGEALDAGDAGSASKFAHSLKGMCGVVRCDNLVNLALSMEHSAKEGNLDKTRQQYAQFSELLTAAAVEMKGFMGQG